MRQLKPKVLIGKTIVDADCDALNLVVLTFDDETELSVWCEPGAMAAGSSIWGFFVEDDENETP